MRCRTLIVSLLGFLTVVTNNVFAAMVVNPAVDTTKDLYYLHIIVFSVCGIIGLAVFCVMFYALAKHRKYHPDQPIKLVNDKAEIIWALIPIIILIVMLIPAITVFVKMHAHKNFEQKNQTTPQAVYLNNT